MAYVMFDSINTRARVKFSKVVTPECKKFHLEKFNNALAPLYFYANFVFLAIRLNNFLTPCCILLKLSNKITFICISWNSFHLQSEKNKRIFLCFTVLQYDSWKIQDSDLKKKRLIRIIVVLKYILNSRNEPDRNGWPTFFFLGRETSKNSPVKLLQ